MCFSNLPVEFDDDGDPYLAEEADDVDAPGEGADDAAETVGVVGDDADAVDVDAVDSDPDAAYREIMASLPAEAREHVSSGGGDGDPSRSDDSDAAAADTADRDHTTAEGD